MIKKPLLIQNGVSHTQTRVSSFYYENEVQNPLDLHCSFNSEKPKYMAF